MTGFQVLVVEDNRDGADSLAECLRFYGFDVRVAYNGTDGLAAALDSLPDAILCDINLPGIDGFEVAKRVRAAVHEPPVLIAISARNERDLVGPAGEAGFDHYFRKPADPAEIGGLLADYAVERMTSHVCS